MRGDWTAERVDMLARLHAEGLSATRIAERLGGNATRSSVIGKAHRLGLAGDRPRSAEKPEAIRAEPKVRARAPQSKPEPAAIIRPPEPPQPAGGGLTIHELQPRSCRWPLGDPRSPDFRYCGCGSRAPGQPYCEAHFRFSLSEEGQRRAGIAP